MRKLLLILFVVCITKNGVANPVNDSIRSYLDRNLRYPKLCQENFISGNIILLIENNDTFISYQCYKQDKYQIFKDEVLRVIKNNDFKTLLLNGQKNILNIEFNISTLKKNNSSYDTLLIDSIKLEEIIESNNTTFYYFNLGEKEKKESDSVLNCFYTNPEHIWKLNSTNYVFEPKNFIDKKKIDSSKIIIRYKYSTMYQMLCNKKKIIKPCSFFNEVSISKNNLIKAVNYKIFDGNLEIEKEVTIENNKIDSLTIALNNLRCFPNQTKHVSYITDGWGCTIEIYYNDKKRIYYYSNPNSYAKDGYSLDKEFMILYEYINSYFK